MITWLSFNIYSIFFLCMAGSEMGYCSHKLPLQAAKVPLRVVKVPLSGRQSASLGLPMCLFELLVGEPLKQE